jgi:hypothetical protein
MKCDIEEVGVIYKDMRDRNVYLVLEQEGEIYYFEPGDFYLGLTKYATRGCKVKDVEEKMIEIAERGDEILLEGKDEDPELGFI